MGLQNKLNRIKQGWIDHIKYQKTRFRVYLLYLFSHPMSEKIIDWLVWINAMSYFISEEFYQNYDDINFFEFIHKTFLCVFFVEILLKIYAFGFRAFLSDKFYI